MTLNPCSTPHCETWTVHPVCSQCERDAAKRAAKRLTLGAAAHEIPSDPPRAA